MRILKNVLFLSLFTLLLISCGKDDSIIIEPEKKETKIFDHWCDWDTEVSANKYIIGENSDSLRVNIRQEGLNPDWFNVCTVTLLVGHSQNKFTFTYEETGESFTKWYTASDFGIDSFSDVQVVGSVFITKSNSYFEDEECDKEGDEWNANTQIE